MQIEQNLDDIITNFAKMSTTDESQRESNIIQSEVMPWATQKQLALQYRHVYMSRLKKLQKRFQILNTKEIDKKGLSQNYIKGIIKRIEKKRVKAYEKNYQEKYDNYDAIYTNEDELQLEDFFTGVIKLNNDKIKLKIKQQCKINGRQVKSIDIPFGVVVVLKGKLKNNSNKFYVDEIITPEIAPQRQLNQKFIDNNNVDYRQKQIMIISEPNIYELIKIKQILTSSGSHYLNNIISLIIIGGLEMKVHAIKQFDEIMFELKESIDVFVMSSSNAERQHMFPLKPYNGLLFPKCKQDIETCSNPQTFNAKNGFQMLVGCGQNVKDYLRNCDYPKNELEVLKQMIMFGHLSPTAPFSLKMEPYQEDYMILEELPHIMVSGKAQQFQTQLIDVKGVNVRLVALPARQTVLVNICDLRAQRFA